MKRFVLLLSLASAVAQAETILMTCERPSGLETYRYTEQFFGFGETKYEIRTEGQWVPICAPSESSYPFSATITAFDATQCFVGDKAITIKKVSKLGNQPWATITTETVDFVTLSYKYVIKSHSRESTQCKRLNRG